MGVRAEARASRRSTSGSAFRALRTARDTALSTSSSSSPSTRYNPSVGPAGTTEEAGTYPSCQPAPTQLDFAHICCSPATRYAALAPDPCREPSQQEDLRCVPSAWQPECCPCCSPRPFFLLACHRAAPAGLKRRRRRPPRLPPLYLRRTPAVLPRTEQARRAPIAPMVPRRSRSVHRPM